MKITVLIALFFLVLCEKQLPAQFIVTTTSSPYTSPYDFQFQSDGTLFASGYYVGAGATYLGTANAANNNGIGTKMVWFAGKAAFRAGKIDGDNTITASAASLIGKEWDDANIGIYSAAFGIDTVASGNWTLAVGRLSIATASGAVALGYYSEATGLYAVAAGNTSRAYGTSSVAMGSFNWANNSYATAFGSYNTANGYSSVALGRYTETDGNYSSSLGYYTSAYAYGDLATGRYNLGSLICTHASGGDVTSTTNWYAADPILEVGNGSSDTARSNALTVYKNGNANVQGSVTAGSGFITTPSSISTTDIPMFGH